MAVVEDPVCGCASIARALELKASRSQGRCMRRSLTAMRSFFGAAGIALGCIRS
jgi:hypothetical protein